MALFLLVAGAARAEGELASGEPKESCADKWGCWELLLSGQGSVLGAKLSLSRVGGEGPRTLDAGILATYASEHHATHATLTVHLALTASLGGGTAGNERMLILQPDFGWRPSITPHSGPFLRAGTSVFHLGTRELYFSLFEPLRALVGYQFLDGRSKLLEVGITHGFVALGSYRAADDRARSLDRATDQGLYVSGRWGSLRGHGSFAHVSPEADDPRSGLDLYRVAVCSYALDVTLCGDILYIRGDGGGMGKQDHFRHALYLGITLGLSP